MIAGCVPLLLKLFLDLSEVLFILEPCDLSYALQTRVPRNKVSKLKVLIVVSLCWFEDNGILTIIQPAASIPGVTVSIPNIRPTVFALGRWPSFRAVVLKRATLRT